MGVDIPGISMPRSVVAFLFLGPLATAIAFVAFGFIADPVGSLLELPERLVGITFFAYLSLAFPPVLVATLLAGLAFAPVVRHVVAWVPWLQGGSLRWLLTSTGVASVVGLAALTGAASLAGVFLGGKPGADVVVNAALPLGLLFAAPGGAIIGLLLGVLALRARRRLLAIESRSTQRVIAEASPQA